MTEGTTALVSRAIARDPVAVRQLVDTLAPVVHVRVARALARRNRKQSVASRQELEDIFQEVFVALFARDARALRAWDPARGMSLLNFVGLIAEHQTATILQGGRRSEWGDEAFSNADDLEPADARPGPESELAARELYGALLARMRAELTPKGLHLFVLLMVEERSIEEVCAATSMQPDAVYAWRSRLAKLARRLASELLAERTVSDSGRDASIPKTSPSDDQRRDS